MADGLGLISEAAAVAVADVEKQEKQQKKEIKAKVAEARRTLPAKLGELPTTEAIEESKREALSALKEGVEEAKAEVITWREGKEAEFKADNVQLGTGEWVPKEVYEGLADDLKVKLSELGIEDFNTQMSGSQDRLASFISGGFIDLSGAAEAGLLDDVELLYASDVAEKGKEYLIKKAEYEQFLKESEVYGEASEEYKKYLDRKKEYEDYLEQLKAYNTRQEYEGNIAEYGEWAAKKQEADSLRDQYNSQVDAYNAAVVLYKESKGDKATSGDMANKLGWAGAALGAVAVTPVPFDDAAVIVGLAATLGVIGAVNTVNQLKEEGLEWSPSGLYEAIRQQILAPATWFGGGSAVELTKPSWNEFVTADEYMVRATAASVGGAPAVPTYGGRFGLPVPPDVAKPGRVSKPSAVSRPGTAPAEVAAPGDVNVGVGTVSITHISEPPFQLEEPRPYIKPFSEGFTLLPQPYAEGFLPGEPVRDAMELSPFGPYGLEKIPIETIEPWFEGIPLSTPAKEDYLYKAVVKVMEGSRVDVDVMWDQIETIMAKASVDLTAPEARLLTDSGGVKDLIADLEAMLNAGDRSGVSAAAEEYIRKMITMYQAWNTYVESIPPSETVRPFSLPSLPYYHAPAIVEEPGVAAVTTTVPDVVEEPGEVVYIEPVAVPTVAPTVGVAEVISPAEVVAPEVISEAAPDVVPAAVAAAPAAVSARPAVRPLTREAARAAEATRTLPRTITPPALPIPFLPGFPKPTAGGPELEELEGSVTWRQGKRWALVKPPYDKITYLDSPPPGVTIVRGKGSAAATIRKYGEIPEAILVDMGAVDVVVEDAEPSPRIRFYDDKKKRTKLGYAAGRKRGRQVGRVIR